MLDKAAPAYRQKKDQNSEIVKTTSVNPPNQKEYPVGKQSLNCHQVKEPEGARKIPQNHSDVLLWTPEWYSTQIGDFLKKLNHKKTEEKVYSISSVFLYTLWTSSHNKREAQFFG